MPKKGQNMSETEVIVPTTEQFFTVEGEVNDKVHDISFEGLNFEYNQNPYGDVEIHIMEFK